MAGRERRSRLSNLSQALRGNNDPGTPSAPPPGPDDQDDINQQGHVVVVLAKILEELKKVYAEVGRCTGEINLLRLEVVKLEARLTNVESFVAEARQTSGPTSALAGRAPATGTNYSPATLGYPTF